MTLICVFREKQYGGAMSQIRVTSEGMKVKVDAHMRQQGSMR